MSLAAPNRDSKKLTDCLQSLNFLHRLKNEELERLLQAMNKRFVPAGATVYSQGDKADSFYVVASGRLNVLQKSGFSSSQIAVVKAGQYFGDNALLGDGLHQCSVVAETNCELYRLHKEDFERILMANADIRSAIKAHVARIRTGHALE